MVYQYCFFFPLPHPLRNVLVTLMVETGFAGVRLIREKKNLHIRSPGVYLQEGVTQLGVYAVSRVLILALSVIIRTMTFSAFLVSLNAEQSANIPVYRGRRFESVKSGANPEKIIQLQHPQLQHPFKFSQSPLPSPFPIEDACM